MKNLLRVLLLAFFVSCGIPSFDYIDGAIISDNDSSGFTFKLDLEESSYTTGFKLYSRYFIGSDSRFFEDLDINDTSNDSEKYLENLGFTVVTVEESLYVEYDEYSVLSTSFFVVSYDNDLVDSVTMQSENGHSYILKSNYKNSSNKIFIHNIGNYSDDYGSNFLNEFKTNVGDGSLINVEFAIVNKGLSSDIEHIESLPIYITPLELQIF